ncbi:MAG: hypothetical protein Aurels2KO_54940 [Aureliella sp.]
MHKGAVEAAWGRTHENVRGRAAHGPRPKFSADEELDIAASVETGFGPPRKLTEEPVEEVIDAFAAGEFTKSELARRFGVSEGTIRNTLRNSATERLSDSSLAHPRKPTQPRGRVQRLGTQWQPNDEC